ncbi:hypothetical protein LTS10_011050 [Elasticomyces elasticus]|nr:hypothetical protein LTS10_011050 [Elasticomyces elasticus]
MFEDKHGPYIFNPKRMRVFSRMQHSGLSYVSCDMTIVYIMWPLKSIRAMGSQPWRDMLLTQPPCTAMSVCISSVAAGNNLQYRCATLRSVDGITLGIAAETVEKMMKNDLANPEEVEVQVQFMAPT